SRLRNALSQAEWQLERDPILLLAGRVSIAEGHRLAVERDGIGKRVGVVAQVLAASEVSLRHAEKIPVRMLAQQAVQFVERRHILDAPGIKIKKRLVEVR